MCNEWEIREISIFILIFHFIILRYKVEEGEVVRFVPDYEVVKIGFVNLETLRAAVGKGSQVDDFFNRESEVVEEDESSEDGDSSELSDSELQSSSSSSAA